MTEQKGIHVQCVAWPAVEAALTAGATAVLPVGAAAKEHGWHLPMSADWLLAEWLAQRLVESCHVAAWPTLSYGFYPAFLDYPGSCSLKRATFEAVVTETVNDLLRSGARAVLIINTGISTIEPLAAAAQQTESSRRVRVASVYRGERYLAAAQRLAEQGSGGHADELETSILLAIAPALVHMERAEGMATPLAHGPFNRSDPERPNYSPSGASGEPRLASRAKGEALLTAMQEDLRALLGSLADVQELPVDAGRAEKE